MDVKLAVMSVKAGYVVFHSETMESRILKLWDSVKCSRMRSRGRGKRAGMS